MLIKICGVHDPEIALFSAKAGAHFVGMILTPGFARSVSVGAAQAICETVKEAGVEPVAVFVSETPEDVERICREIGVRTVQYYKPEPIASHLRRFYINEPQVTLRPNDHLLMESGSPGTGTKIEAQTFIRPAPAFFLAGGLNPDNVEEMIKSFRPSGVDVSSGVEKEGRKDKELILEFIEKARSYAQH